MATLTVCITTYNRWEICLNALKSVCDQQNVDVEVILVDDCSAEPMPEFIARFVAEKGVVPIRHKTNKGLAAARNTAIDIARGEYFSFCDDDDQWPQGMANGLVKAMRRAPEGIGIGVGLSLSRKSACRQILGGYPNLTDIIRQGFTPPVGAQIYDTELLREVGGYNSEVKSGVDHDLWISLAKINPQVVVAWGFAATVGTAPGQIRMTTDEARRRNHIAASLQFWEPTITNVFGAKFFQHFTRSYQQYLDYKFLFLDLRAGRYLAAFRRGRQLFLMTMLIKQVTGKILGRSRCNLFPSFKG